MAVIVHTLQPNFTSGELDPLLSEREDLKFYYSGASKMENVIPFPQGGFRRRPGLEYLQALRNTLAVVDLSGVAETAPEGGVAANATDGSSATVLTTTADVASTNPFVVLHLDFGAAVAVDLVDVVDISLETGTLDNEFRVQYSTDDVDWTDFGVPFNLADSARSRRRQAPATVTARYWRVARIGSTATAAKVTLTDIFFWAETTILSEVYLLPFTFSDEQKYTMVITDRNIDVFNAGVRVASISSPHLSADLATTNFTQSLDTLELFHKDHAPYRIFRQGSNDEFDFRPQAFKNIPQFDFGDTAGGTNEVQQIEFFTFVAGETINIFLDGERTNSIAYGATIAETATNIQTALRALPNTSATGISCSGAGQIVTITFAGDDGKTDWPEVIVAVLTSAAGTAIPSTVTEGEPPGEDIMSATRGWPRCGTFYQQRTYLGGLRSLPSHFLASVAGQFFDLDDRTTRDDKGFVVVADQDQAAVIYQLFPGRHLQIYTSSMEFFIPSEPIAPLTVAPKATTRRGIPEGLRVYEAEGAAFFVQRGGNAVRENRFIDKETGYEAEHVSLLASHMVVNPVSTAIRRSRAADAADWLVLVNGTGDVALLTTLGDQNVTAWSRHTTPGTILQVSAEEDGDLYFAVERTINGATVRYLERWNESLFMDAGGIVSVSTDTTTLSGLDHLEGEAVKFFIDGSPAGEVVVTAGVATLPRTAKSQIIYGLNFKPHVITMPVKFQLPDGTLVGRKKRVTDVAVSLQNTTGLAVGANDGAVQELPFRNLGADLLDRPMSDFSFTGIKEANGLRNWTEQGLVELIQNEPGPLTVRGIKMKVAA